MVTFSLVRTHSRGNSDQLGTTEGYGTIVTAVGFVTGLLVFFVGTLLSWWHHG